MNEEIKEILEEIKEKNETYEDCVEDGIIENEYYKSHLLLNYITNLQEERDFYKCTDSMNVESNIKLRDRIDKAVEYIEKEYKENIIIADYCDNPITPQDLYNDILNILKGDDTNE